MKKLLVCAWILPFAFIQSALAFNLGEPKPIDQHGKVVKPSWNYSYTVTGSIIEHYNPAKGKRYAKIPRKKFQPYARPTASPMGFLWLADRHGTCESYVAIGDWRVHNGHWDRCWLDQGGAVNSKGWYQEF